METDLIIVDNFYTDPVAVVEYAKNMEWFDDYGNHPGLRTKEEQHESVFNAMSNIIQSAGGNITNWSDMTYNGCFNLCNKDAHTWIHADTGNTWASVVYLTPDAPSNAGTGIFKHKATGLDQVPTDANGNIDEDKLAFIYKDANDWSKWEMTDYVANKFNRLVVYRGKLFHTAINYFGNDFTDGRMHQTFFFNTEY